MTNAKIEKIDTDIAKTKKKILEQQTKLRSLERQRKIEEDAEIVAFFRREILSDNDLSELLHKKSGASSAVTDEGEEPDERI